MKSADELARWLVSTSYHEDFGEQACIQKVRLQFPDAEAERTVRAAIRWKAGLDKNRRAHKERGVM